MEAGKLSITQQRCNNKYLKIDVKVQFSLEVLGKITCFTRGEQAIVNSCHCNTRLQLVLQTLHLLAIACLPSRRKITNTTNVKGTEL